MLLLPLILLLALVLAPSALAAPPSRGPTTPGVIQAAVARGEISADTGRVYLARALAAPEQLPERYRGTARWDGTLPLLQLRREARTMRRDSAREEVRTLLADAATTCGDKGGSLPTIYPTSHFYVESAPPSHLQLTQFYDTLEFAWNAEVGQFGWAAPPTLAPGGRYHVRIQDIESTLLGFVSATGTYAGLVGNNSNTTWDDEDAYASCMVLNRNLTSIDEMQATVAHEFNHSLQFGYGALNGPNAASFFLTEAAATWMEDEVFTGTTDNQSFPYPRFSDSLAPHCTGYEDPPACAAIPPNDIAAEAYSGWFIVRGLTERFGTGAPGGSEDVMQRFWELTSQNAADNLGALDQALGARGVSLGTAYHDGAVAWSFVRDCQTGPATPPPLPYCFTDGDQYFNTAGLPNTHGRIDAVGGSHSATIEDNYATQFIQLPEHNPLARYSVAVVSEAGTGVLRATVGCLRSGALVLQPVAAAIGAGQVRLLDDFDARSCDQLSTTAIVTTTSRTGDRPTTDSALPYRVTTAQPGSSQTLNVSLAGTGSGSVSSAPGGISCGTTCGAIFGRGTQVTLTAAPAGGSVFSGWGGACAGGGACTVTLDGPKDVVATFTADPTPPPPPPPPPRPPAPPPTARDTTAPRLGLTVASRSRRGRIKITVTCPRTEQSRCTGSLALTAKAGKRTVRLGTKRLPALAPGRSTTLTFKISAAQRKRLRVRRITLDVDARAADTAGNQRRQRATLRTRLA